MRSMPFAFLSIAVLNFSAAAIDWQAYPYKARDGREITDAEIGRLTVPENHATGDGADIELAFVRFRSTADEPGPPIVWLAGGPGDYGTDDIEGPFLDLVRAFQSVADVIALDQRGTGLSVPRLDCPEHSVKLAYDKALDPDEMAAAYADAATHCAEYWEEQGVDLTAYNSVESAHDLNALRAALGVETISLYGGSYGTHLALAMLRLHPDRVHRVVLSGVEGPDHSWKLPSLIEHHFVEVARAFGDSTGATLVDRMRRVLARLRNEPVTVTVDLGEGQSQDVVVGAYELQLGTRLFLGDLDNIRNLPAIWSAMECGDFSLLGRLAYQLREVRVGSAMTYAMDCASGATSARLDRIRREAGLPHSLVGSALNAPFPKICDAWPHRDLGDEFRGPLVCDVPVLFLSGVLDGHTPPSNVAELLAGFSNGHHVVVENGSHQYLDLALPEIRDILADFLAGVEPETELLSAPKLSDSTE